MQSGTLSQSDLIVMYQQMKAEAEGCDRQDLLAHYDHILFALQKLIESHGPTELYRELVQSSPRDLANQQSFTVDL
jgi:hypothetical protein